MDKLELEILNSIVSEQQIDVRAPGREGWHPCEKPHGTSLPGFTPSTCSLLFAGSTERSARDSELVTIRSNSEGLGTNQDFRVLCSKPRLTGLADPSVRMILGTYPSEPVPFSTEPGSVSGPAFLT